MSNDIPEERCKLATDAREQRLGLMATANWRSMTYDPDRRHLERKALKEVLHAIFDQTTNLIGTDFADISVEQVDDVFPHGFPGVRIQFTISNDAMGKVGWRDDHQASAFEALLTGDFSEFDD